MRRRRQGVEAFTRTADQFTENEEKDELGLGNTLDHRQGAAK
jgi:hypothetical protein